MRRIARERDSAAAVIPRHRRRPLLARVHGHDLSLRELQAGCAEGLAERRHPRFIELHAGRRVLQVLRVRRTPPADVVLERPRRGVVGVGYVKG